MKVGVLVLLNKDIKETLKKVAEMGIYSCQICSGGRRDYTDEMAALVKEGLEESGVEISALWCSWSGPRHWNFYDGPSTLGIVPAVYRYDRCLELKEGSDFAKKIGATDIITHVGFIPEYPKTTEYNDVVIAIRYVANYAKLNGQNFLFETGQETPITLRRTIEDVGLDNLFINLDPANLILYGKANPVDALDVFGKYVRNIHGKDGFYPTNGYELGREARMGDGKVNYPEFIKKLKEIGYDGPITIEREISGEEQRRDIVYAKKYLEDLFDKLEISY